MLKTETDVKYLGVQNDRNFSFTISKNMRRSISSFLCQTRNMFLDEPLKRLLIKAISKQIIDMEKCAAPQKQV